MGRAPRSAGPGPITHPDGWTDGLRRATVWIDPTTIPAVRAVRIRARGRRPGARACASGPRGHRAVVQRRPAGRGRRAGRTAAMPTPPGRSQRNAPARHAAAMTSATRSTHALSSSSEIRRRLASRSASPQTSIHSTHDGSRRDDGRYTSMARARRSSGVGQRASSERRTPAISRSATSPEHRLDQLVLGWRSGSGSALVPTPSSPATSRAQLVHARRQRDGAPTRDLAATLVGAMRVRDPDVGEVVGAGRGNDRQVVGPTTARISATPSVMTRRRSRGESVERGALGARPRRAADDRHAPTARPVEAAR